MRAPEGYSIRKVLVDQPRKYVAVALRDRDGSEVVLKAYRDESDASAADVRARCEFEALRSLPTGVAPLALELEVGEDTTCLVLEAFHGCTPRGALGAAEFLPIAIAAAGALASIHAARMVHRSIAPAKLLYDEPSGQLRITGFGRSAPLGAPADFGGILGRASPNALFYLSPEQSGRLDRGIDFRSDLYSLGATFYELLSGRPPFDARDPLDLIQAHIARRPRSPAELRDGVSGTLARITMKLLEKEPEDRYQTAEALGIDLETCLEQLQRIGTIDDELPLGAADAPYRPLFRRRIYGRESECETLRRAYRQASQGRASLVLVRGAPGIGKSSLIPELYQPLALDGGYLTRGKFDLYRRHLPYAGFASALRSLLRQIETENATRREEWKRALLLALGPLSGALSEFLPELSSLLGELPQVPRLDPGAAKQRLSSAVRRLIRVAADRARPLVLFLDDLQWADAGSRFLMEELLLTGGDAPLLVIGAYRDDEVDSNHPLSQLRERIHALGVPVDELALSPLTQSAVCELLRDALGRDPESIQRLAQRIEDKSGNNPLLIQQCVYHLHQLEHIRYEPPTGWTWNESAVARAVIPDDPVGMMLVRLQRLSGETRSVVQLASCVGDEFDVSLLAELSRRDRTALEAALYELSDEGLIAPSRAGFRFVHDRIREAAQALLPESEREVLHYRTAELLIEQHGGVATDTRVFEIADHLARARARIPSAQLASSAKVQRDAAMAALRSGAFATAIHYFETGLELIEPCTEPSQLGLWFEMRFRAAVCAYQLESFDRALELIAPFADARLSRLQAALVASLRILVFAVSRSETETLDLLFDSLAEFDFRAPRRPSWLRVRLEILRIDCKLRGSPARWPFRRATGTSDSADHLHVLLLLASSATILRASVRLCCLFPAEDLRSALAAGYVRPPSLPLAVFASARRAVLWSSRGLRRYIEAVEYWMEQVPHPAITPITRITLYADLLPWVSPRRETLDPLLEAATQLEELGQAMLQTRALLAHARHAALCGLPIATVLGHLETIRVRATMSPVETPSALAQPYRWLQEHTDGADALARARVQLEAYAESGSYLATSWMLTCTIVGDFASVWHISELVRASIFERAGRHSHITEYLLYRGLAAAVLSHRGGIQARTRFRHHARSCERRLSVVAKHGPDFVHMVRMLRAERGWALGRGNQALEEYAQAAEAAEKIGYIHHAAIAHERRAHILREGNLSSNFHEALQYARESYHAWGALAKAESLRSQPPSTTAPDDAGADSIRTAD